MNFRLGAMLALCLTGTAVFSGCTVQTWIANREARQEWAEVQEKNKALADQCKSSFETPELDAIRHKVELHREWNGGPPPFEILSNDAFPTAAELPVIAKWAALRDECYKRWQASASYPPSANPLQVAFVQKLKTFGDATGAAVSELTVSLHKQKLTYGEFARKRYDITKAIAEAERQYRETTLLADYQRQIEAQTLAQQQLQNTLLAWSSYMRAVNARQPQTVGLQGSLRLNTNCTSLRTGSMVNTTCF